jgi:hypothetical protein
MGQSSSSFLDGAAITEQMRPAVAAELGYSETILVGEVMTWTEGDTTWISGRPDWAPPWEQIELGHAETVDSMRTRHPASMALLSSGRGRMRPMALSGPACSLLASAYMRMKRAGQRPCFSLTESDRRSRCTMARVRLSAPGRARTAPSRSAASLCWTTSAGIAWQLKGFRAWR